MIPILSLILCLLSPQRAFISIEACSEKQNQISLSVHVKNTSNYRQLRLPGIRVKDGLIHSWNWGVLIHRDDQEVFINEPIYAKMEKQPDLIVSPNGVFSFELEIDTQQLIDDQYRPIQYTQGIYTFQIYYTHHNRKYYSNIVKIATLKNE